jgi:hypothetical protein
MALFYADYSLRLLGLRDGNFKFINDVDSTRLRLFDLDGDPLESHDIATAQQTSFWYSAAIAFVAGVVKTH